MIGAWSLLCGVAVLLACGHVGMLAHLLYVPHGVSVPRQPIAVHSPSALSLASVPRGVPSPGRSRSYIALTPPIPRPSIEWGWLVRGGAACEGLGLPDVHPPPQPTPSPGDIGRARVRLWGGGGGGGGAAWCVGYHHHQPTIITTTTTTATTATTTTASTASATTMTTNTTTTARRRRLRHILTAAGGAGTVMVRDCRDGEPARRRA